MNQKFTIFLVAVIASLSTLLGLTWNKLPVTVEPALGSVENRITGSMTNTVASVSTAGTNVLAIPTGLQYLRADNNSAFNTYCFLETSTLASSSIVVNSGRRLGAVATTTFWGQSYMEIGPDTLLNYVGGNLNCKSFGATSTILLQYK